MSLLTITQDACDKIGLTRPSAVLSSVDGNIRTLLAFANEEGQELIERYGWPDLQAEVTHTTLGQENQGAIETIAPDFGYIIPATFWDRTVTQPVTGPLSPVEWQVLKARTATGPYSQYRLRGGDLLAYPAPPAGNTWHFEYQTNNFCQSTSGTKQSRWQSDTDTGLLDENLMTLGIVWRFKKKNGLVYDEDFRKYEQKLANYMNRVGGKKFLDMQSSGGYPSQGVYVNDGSWNV